MTDAIFHSPAAINETVLSYAPGTKEREQVLAEYDRMMKQKRELPMWIGGKAVETKDRRPARPPHQHKHILGHAHFGDKGHVKQAINAALKAKKDWENMRWEDRAAIFLKAADLISGLEGCDIAILVQNHAALPLDVVVEHAPLLLDTRGKAEGPRVERL